jgi:hypothetical protein
MTLETFVRTYDQNNKNRTGSADKKEAVARSKRRD